MATTINIRAEIFNDVYRPHISDYSKRYNVYWGSAGSGKSHFVFQKLIIKALREKRKVLVARKVARTLKDSVFQMTIDTLEKFGILSQCKINKSTMSIILPNNSSFIYKGLDEVEKLKSVVGITDIIVEEASEISQEDFEQLNLRLRADSGNLQIYLMTNPTSKANWIYTYFFDGNAPEDTFFLHTTYKDNRFLPPDYIKSLEDMIHTNPTMYKIYVLGEWVSISKLVYENWREGELPEDRPENLQLAIGLDFGYVNDPSALIVSWVDVENKKLYIMQEYYKKRMLNSDIARTIKNLGYAKEVIIADSAEQKSIAELKKLGIARIEAAIKGPGSVNQGIQLLQQYEIIVSKNCPNTKAELSNYSYKKDKSTGEYINEPIDKNNHALDALRYSIQSIEKVRKLKTMDKRLFGL